MERVVTGRALSWVSPIRRLAFPGERYGVLWGRLSSHLLFLPWGVSSRHLPSYPESWIAPLLFSITPMGVMEVFVGLCGGLLGVPLQDCQLLKLLLNALGKLEGVYRFAAPEVKVGCGIVLACLA